MCNGAMSIIYTGLMNGLDGQPNPSVRLARLAYAFNPICHLTEVVRAPFLAISIAAPFTTTAEGTVPGNTTSEKALAILDQSPPKILAALVDDLKRNNKPRKVPVSGFILNATK